MCVFPSPPHQIIPFPVFKCLAHHFPFLEQALWHRQSHSDKTKKSKFKLLSGHRGNCGLSTSDKERSVLEETHSRLSLPKPVAWKQLQQDIKSRLFLYFILKSGKGLLEDRNCTCNLSKFEDTKRKDDSEPAIARWRVGREVGIKWEVVRNTIHM